MSTWTEDPGTRLIIRRYAAHALQQARTDALNENPDDPERHDWSVNSRTYQSALRTVHRDAMDKLADANHAPSGSSLESYCIHAARIANAAHELLQVRHSRLIQLRGPDHGPHTRYSRTRIPQETA